jgi:hypothetical protein
VRPIAGEVYDSKSASDCTYDRFVLGSRTVQVQAVHADGTVAFRKQYKVTR